MRKILNTIKTSFYANKKRFKQSLRNYIKEIKRDTIFAETPVSKLKHTLLRRRLPRKLSGIAFRQGL